MLCFELRQKRAERLEKQRELTINKIVSEIEKIAFFDPGAMYDEDGNLKNIKELDERTRKAIASLEIDIAKIGDSVIDLGTKKLKIHNKTTALDMLMKYKNAYTINHKVKIEDKREQKEEFKDRDPKELHRAVEESIRKFGKRQ